MKSFVYNNNSSDSIIDSPLYICEFETQESLPYVTREVVKGEYSTMKGKSNYYGTRLSESLNLKISFVKKNKEYFSIQDRNEIETWLYLKDTPSVLKIKDGNDNISCFDCVCYSIEWKVVGAMAIGATALFECATPYWYTVKTISKTFDSFGNIVFDNYSGNDIIYPKITLKNNSNKRRLYKIKNSRDEDYFSVYVNELSKLIIDTEKCMILTGQSYEDLGLEDAEYISWPRIFKGENVISVLGGSVDVEIEFKQMMNGLGSYFGDVSKIVSEGCNIVESTSTLNVEDGDIEGDALYVNCEDVYLNKLSTS